MKVEEYDVLSIQLLDLANEIEQAKRPAYTTGSDDVLRNFKACAERLGITPGQALGVYFLKHVDALVSALKNPDIPQAEAIVGRIADCINYLKLANALLVERSGVDSVERGPSLNDNHSVRHPLGIMLRHIWLEKRRDDLNAAIQRNMMPDGNGIIPVAWDDERVWIEQELSRA